MSPTRHPALVASLAALAGAGVALTVHHAVRADGIPATTPLLYRGYLERSGMPDDTARMVGASLWDRATDGTRLCDVPAAPVTPSGGRFELALDACVAAVRANRDAWLQLTVDGTPLPRTKLGAVPYAIEAERAQSANNAVGPLLARIAALEARVTANEGRTDPDCPPGYTRVTAEAGFEEAGGNVRRLCRKALPDGSRGDDVVRVGVAPSVFWIDRFEASVVQSSPPYARIFESEPEPAGLSRTGRWNLESGVPRPLSVPFYARSVPGVAPARWVTWFQAMELCRMAGKRLPTGEEWLTAAMGTDDPASDNDGAMVGNERCNTRSSISAPRTTGNGSGCRSSWGAQDMVGNLWEWTAEWYAGAGNGMPPGGFVNNGDVEWPTGYGSDHTWNVNSHVAAGSGEWNGIPSAAFRGGGWDVGTRAGVYSLNLNSGPSVWGGVGFRCVLRR